MQKISLISATLLAAMTLPAFADTTQPWSTTLGSAARNSYAANVTVDDSSIKNSWSLTGGTYSNIVADDQAAYVINVNHSANDTFLLKLNPTTGAVIWQTPVNAKANTHLTLANATIYFLTGDNASLTLNAYQTKDAHLLFAQNISDTSFNNASYQQAPAVDGNHVYLSSVLYFYSFNAQTGQQEWRSHALNSTNLNVSVTKDYLMKVSDRETFAVDKNTGNESGYYLRYDKDTTLLPSDNLVPAYDVSSNTVITFSPVENNNVNMVAYNMSNGLPVFATKVVKSPSLQPVVTPDYFYLATTDSLNCYDMKHGEQTWAWSAVNNRISSMLATDNLLFVSGWMDAPYKAEETLAFNRMTGKLVWEAKLSGELAVTGNMLYINNGNKIAAYQFTSAIK